LPHPLGPVSITNSPFSIESDTFSIDGVFAPTYVNDKLRADIAGIDEDLTC